MAARGFNPMRWECERDGCFNEKRRPKIELFAECFPGKINFGDVDGLVEIGGAFCLLEWKGDGGSLKRGQQLTYEAFTRHSRNVVFIVHGDAETMNVRGYQIYCRGSLSRWHDSDLDQLKQHIRSWAAFAADRSAA